MTDDQTPLDLDAIRERLRLWEEELDRNWTASADLLEELEAALALDVGPLIREVETLRAWQTRILDAIGYDDSPESAAEVLEHAHEWRSAQLAEMYAVTAEVGYLRGERDRARDLAAALEAELETARASETRWLTEVALRATGAWRHGMDDEYEIALLDVLGWWLESRQVPAAAQTIPQLRFWAGKVTEAHERGESLDERTLLALWTGCTP